MSEHETLHKILDLARWAPSGDNTQPWRFEIVAPDHIAVHGHDTRSWCVYDIDGRPSQISHGILLETLAIAATGQGLRAAWSLRAGSPDDAPVYDVRLQPDAALAPHPLLPFIESRTVQRRPMRTQALTPAQRRALGEAVGEGFALQVFEPLAERWRVARLLWASGQVRQLWPEAWHTHSKVIEWGARYSADRLPQKAVGVDPLTGALMHWALHSWERVDFANRYLAGTLIPKIQIDLLPALGCAAHLMLRMERMPQTLEDWVRVGGALQRLWLTATAQGLYLQPQMLSVLLRCYVRQGRRVSTRPGIDEQAAGVARMLEQLTGASQDTGLVAFCRVGAGRAPRARSLRLELSQLLITPPAR